jgi:hypothetical protein
VATRDVGGRQGAADPAPRRRGRACAAVRSSTMTATRNGASSDPSTSQERQASAGDPPDFPQTPRISETWNQSRLRSVRFARATASRIAGRHPRTRCPPPRSAGRRGPPSGFSRAQHRPPPPVGRPTADSHLRAPRRAREPLGPPRAGDRGSLGGRATPPGTAIGGAPRDQHIGQPPAAAVGRPADVDHTARPPPAPRRAAAPAPRAAPPPRRGWPRPGGPALTAGRGG